MARKGQEDREPAALLAWKYVLINVFVLVYIYLNF